MMSGSPGNSHSDNYMDFKLFTTLRPQSNFRINLRFDRELVEVSWARHGVLGLLSACCHSGGRPAHLGSRGTVLCCNSGKKINPSVNECTPN